MNWLRRILYGRNGVDQLSIALLVLGMVATLAATLFSQSWLSILSWLCMVLVFYRILSRNLPKRRQENVRFLGLFGRVSPWLRLRYRMLRELRTYKYVQCPRCKQYLRAPRGRGRISITCQKCKERFEQVV